MRAFHFAVIYNDEIQYQDFRSSLQKAGFVDSNTRLTAFDNTGGNRFEPFACINRTISTTDERYLVFCHQDIRFDRGDGHAQLVSRLEELTLLDSSWAIAGNAGVNFRFQNVIRITDPNQSPNWQGSFPQRAMTLDENLLIFNVGQRPKASHQLAGFHFYGADTCLHAYANNKSVYVIDFHITHLSGGSFSEEFWTMRRSFESLWSASFSFSFVRTVTGQTICLSRTRWLRGLGSMKWISKLFTKVLHYHGLNPNSRIDHIR